MPVFDALIGPVVLCFAVWVYFPPVCVWTKCVPACVSGVRERNDLEVFPAPVHLIMELVFFEEVGFECAHDRDFVFSPTCWCSLPWDDDFCPQLVKGCF